MIISAVGGISLFYNLSTDETTAFNSVFARIWQFSLGIVAHFNTMKKKEVDLQTIF